MACSSPRCSSGRIKRSTPRRATRCMVRVTREATRIKDAAGEIVRVLERATRTFVGTYFERDGEALRPRRRHRVLAQHLRRRPRREGREAARQGRHRDAALPDAGRTRRRRHRGGARPARPTRRGYALGHPRLRIARRVLRRRHSPRPDRSRANSRKTISPAARTSPMNSSSRSTRRTRTTSTTRSA